MSSSVFISYSRKDKKWMELLKNPLRALSLHAGGARPFADEDLEIGVADFRAELDRQIDEASAAVLLITNDFLGSEFIREHEVPRLLERRERERLPIFPVLVKTSVWSKIPWLEEMNLKTFGDGRRSEAVPLAALSDDEIEGQLSRLAEKIYDRLQFEESRGDGHLPAGEGEPAPPAERIADGPGAEEAESRPAAAQPSPAAPPVELGGHLARMTQRRGDAEPILYTFCGLKPADPRASPPAVGFSSVLRLWADPSHEGNWIRTALGAEGALEFFRVRYWTEPGDYPCDVTLRPGGFQPLVNDGNRPLLALDARGAPTEDTPRRFVQGLSVRVIDRHATQWRKGVDATESVDLPLDGRWYTVLVDLRRHWQVFGADGNHRYAADALDGSLIAAVVVELGGLSRERLGWGGAQVDLANIRFADATDDCDPDGHLCRTG